MAFNYVKFQRGTPSNFEILKQRNLVESNTLYFLYEENASQGSLYLGNILIGTVGQGDSSISTLSNLSDVLLTNVGATDILTYSSDGKWKNVSITQIADLIAAQQGLGFQVDTKAFSFTPVEGINVLKLAGFEEAAAGSSPFKAVDGSLQWSTASIDSIATDVGNLQESLETLQQQVSTLNHLKYVVANNIGDVLEDNIVYLVPKENAETNNEYDEFMLVNGSPERLGDWGVNLEGYATTQQLQAVQSSLDILNNNFENNYVSNTKFDSVVGNLTDLLTYTEGTTTNIVNEINNIYQQLVWTEITLD